MVMTNFKNTTEDFRFLPLKYMRTALFWVITQ